jgi:hypothetical protein
VGVSTERPSSERIERSDDNTSAEKSASNECDTVRVQLGTEEHVSEKRDECEPADEVWLHVRANLPNVAFTISGSLNSFCVLSILLHPWQRALALSLSPLCSSSALRPQQRRPANRRHATGRPRRRTESDRTCKRDLALLCSHSMPFFSRDR